MISPFKGKRPVIHKDAYVEESAQIIGDVVMGEHSSVWFNAVVRGDIHFIRIGRYTNIQDNASLHVTRNTFPLVVGDFVTVGHGAILHGCTVSSHVLIGMGAIIMDGAEIGENCIIGAGAMVKQGMVIPPRSVVKGLPASVVREVTEEEVKLIAIYADNYYHYKLDYQKDIGG